MTMMWIVDECLEMRECPQSIGHPRKLLGNIDDDDEEEEEEKDDDD